MSQQIRVLQCIECSLYQVDIVKKSNKWDCKVCRHKQSVLREFTRGSGAECRLKVQELNLQRGLQRQAQDDRKIAEVQKAEDSGIDAEVLSVQRPSKWAAFVDEPIRRETNISSSPRIANQPQDDSSFNDVMPSSRRGGRGPSKWGSFVKESDSIKTETHPQSKSSQLTKRPSKWAAYVDEPVPKMRRTSPLKRQELDFDEQEHSSTTTRPCGFNKRQSVEKSFANQKPVSKWQKFL